eukprot:11199629-Lingulodinium_polyedra.AAC.1
MITASRRTASSEHEPYADELRNGPPLKESRSDSGPKEPEVQSQQVHEAGELETARQKGRE